MLPTLFYHLDNPVNNVKIILDDDKDKNNMEYKNIKVKVKFAQKYKVPQGSNFLITSLENKIRIKKRLNKFKPQIII